MAFCGDLGRATFNTLLKTCNKGLGLPRPHRGSRLQSISYAHRSSFAHRSKNHSAHHHRLKSSSNLEVRHSCGLDWNARSITTSSKASFSSAESLMKSSGGQFSSDVLSLIGLCKEGWRQNLQKSRCTIVDPRPAITAASALLPDLNHEDVIVEINPGPGFLTQQLLERTSNKVIIFESREFFRDRLASAFRSEIEAGRLVVSAHNFYNFYSYYLHHQEHSNDPELRSLGIIPVEPQRDRLQIKVVGGITARKFFSRLLLCTMLGISFMERCDPVFYLYVTDELYKKFFSTLPMYGFKRFFKFLIISNFIFKVDKVCTEECTGFYPLLRQGKKQRVCKIDASLYHLLRIEPNSAFLNKLSRTERELFMYFVVQVSHSARQKLLIDTLEMWLPGIGVQLIDAGFNVYTYTVQLSMEEILFVYQMFRSHPNFSGCSFAQNAHAWFSKLTLVESDLVS